MKIALKCPLLVIPVALCAASATTDIKKDITGRGLRGKSSQTPSWLPADASVVSGHYFGLHFHDSPAAVNPWVTEKSARIVDDLDPVAPLDRMDKTLRTSYTGAAPVTPGKSEAAIGYTQPDFVPPYLHPRPFPKEIPPRDANGIMIPLEDQVVVAHEDRLRSHGNMQNMLDPLNMYPLVAPAEKINPGPWPVATLDAVPATYDKFFDQSQQRDYERKNAKKLVDAFTRVDEDKDQAISHTEFEAEVKGHQKKTDDQAQVLWNQYHTSEDPDMSRSEFYALAKTGFDLGKKFVNRTDISSTLTPPNSINMGFWGGGAACPNNTYIKGAQIKVKPISADGSDNTAMNGVKFKCEDDSTIQTAEGPDGAWTGWAECEKGQRVHSVSLRMQAYSVGQDNTGINDLLLKCWSKGHEDETTLMFGPEKPPQQDQTGYIFVNGAYIPKSQTDVDDKAVKVGKGTTANAGGWSEELDCGETGALCGAQGRLFQVDGNKDNIGMTDIRLFCCSDSIDCSGPCADKTSTECKACKAQSNPMAPR